MTAHISSPLRLAVASCAVLGPFVQPSSHFLAEIPMEERERLCSAIVGDIDGDGVDDYAIGCPESSGAASRDGEVWLFSGKSGHVLWRTHGDESEARLGNSLVGAGDLDGDSVPDVACTTFGGVSMLVLDSEPSARLGGARRQRTQHSGRLLALSGRDGSVIWVRSGRSLGDGFGSSVIAIDDMNGDSCQELIVVARAGNARPYLACISGAGESVLWLTESTKEGEPLSAGFGSSIATIGDETGDGYRDFAVGDPGLLTDGSAGGGIYIANGRSGDLVSAILQGVSGDHLGASLDYLAGDPHGIIAGGALHRYIELIKTGGASGASSWRIGLSHSAGSGGRAQSVRLCQAPDGKIYVLSGADNLVLDSGYKGIEIFNGHNGLPIATIDTYGQPSSVEWASDIDRDGGVEVLIALPSTGTARLISLKRLVASADADELDGSVDIERIHAQSGWRNR